MAQNCSGATMRRGVLQSEYVFSPMEGSEGPLFSRVNVDDHRAGSAKISLTSFGQKPRGFLRAQAGFAMQGLWTPRTRGLPEPRLDALFDYEDFFIINSIPILGPRTAQVTCQSLLSPSPRSDRPKLHRVFLCSAPSSRSSTET